MSSEQRRLLRVREVAELLGLSRTAVYEMVYSGQIVAIRCAGGRTAIRIPTEEIEAWIAREKASAVTARWA